MPTVRFRLPRWIVVTIAAAATTAVAFFAVTLLLQRQDGELLSFCRARQQCGYIDADGQIVIEPRYEAAGDWARDAGRVWQGGLVGSIDRRGTIITPPQYPSFAVNAGGSYSVPVGGKLRLTDHALRPANPELWDGFKGIKIDRTLHAEPDYIAAERDGRFALLDGSGGVIVAPRYEDIGWRSHQFPLLVKERGQFAHIAENGTPISAERWSDAGMFYNNLASVTRDGKCGYIGLNGTVAIPLAFDECRNFWTANAAIVRRGNVFSLIDRGGRILRDGLEEVAIPAEDDNPIAVRVGGLWGTVDSKGDYRVPPSFEAIDPLAIAGDLLPIVPIGRTTVAYRVRRNGKVGLLAIDGGWILQPAYDQIEVDEGGDGKLAAFRDGDKWGFVDLETRKATPASWDEVNARQRADLIPVRAGPQWGYVDGAGNSVIAPRFDDAREFVGDWAAVAVGERWGFVDNRGGQVMPLVFRTVAEYTPERARVVLFESRGWLTRQGRLLGISDDDLKRAGLKN
jgi:hypothetical protein